MSLAVASALCQTTCSRLNSALVDTAAGLKRRIAVQTQEAKHLWPMVGVGAIDVFHDRLQGPVIPHERMRVEKTIGVVTSLRQWGALLLTPTKVMPSDGVSSGALHSIANYLIDCEALARGNHIYDTRWIDAQ